MELSSLVSLTWISIIQVTKKIEVSRQRIVGKAKELVNWGVMIGTSSCLQGPT